MANSEEDSAPKPKYKAIAVAAAPILAGGLYLAWNYANNFSKKRSKPKDDRPKLARCVSFATLHGGKLALEKMHEYYHHRANEADQSDSAALYELKTLLEIDRPNFKELQRILMKIEMTRKEDEAVKELQKALEKARKENKSHEEYEIEMLLVEMLIYKGDFEKALSCKCLHEKHVSDARRPLYKAIIHCLLKSSGDIIVQHFWEEFKEARTNLLLSPIDEEHDHFYQKIIDFDEFKKVVSVLEKDILEARRLKTQ